MIEERRPAQRRDSRRCPRPRPPRRPPAPPPPGRRRRGERVVLAQVRIEDGAIDYTCGRDRHRVVASSGSTSRSTQGATAEPLRSPGRGRRAGRDPAQPSNATLAPGAGRALGEAIAPRCRWRRATSALAAVLVARVGVAGRQGHRRIGGTPDRLTASGLIGLDAHARGARPQCAGEPRRLELDAVRLPLASSRGQLDSAPLAAQVAGGTVSARHPSRSARPDGDAQRDQVKGVQLGPVLVDYLCQRYAVTGPLDLTGEARSAARRRQRLSGVNGSGRLHIGPGNVVGREALSLAARRRRAGRRCPRSTRPAARRASPLDFDSITATYTDRQRGGPHRRSRLPGRATCADRGGHATGSPTDASRWTCRSPRGATR